jgi:hypothetical protein
MLERYLIPLAPYILIALAALGGWALFASLEKELRQLKSGIRYRAELDGSTQEEFQTRLTDLHARLRAAEERASFGVQPAVGRLNLTTRTQVIRLSRRGAPAANIAASLNLPRKEVELVLKIDGLTSAATEARAIPGP